MSLIKYIIKKRDDNSGSVILEFAIIIPIFMAVFVAMIYIAIWSIKYFSLSQAVTQALNQARINNIPLPQVLDFVKNSTRQQLKGIISETEYEIFSLEINNPKFQYNIPNMYSQPGSFYGISLKYNIK